MPDAALPALVTEQHVADRPKTAEEVAALAALRALLGPELETALHPRDRPYWASDHALGRTLGARGNSPEAAAKMWRAIAAFRTSRRCYALLDGPSAYREPEALRRYFPWGFAGVDRAGFPVLVERIGQIDLVGIGQAAAGEDGAYGPFLEWVAWYHEVQETMMRGRSAAASAAATAAAAAQAQAAGLAPPDKPEVRDRHKMTCIIDLGGLSLRHCSTATLSVLMKRTRLEEDHYPEVVRRVFLINTPSFFASVWGIVRRFVDPGTAAKFQILGADFLPVLREFIDDSSIPAYLGGSLRDPLTNDPECRTMVCPGGLVALPYLHPHVSGDGRGAGEEVALPAGRASDLTLHVPPGATVRWAWATAEKDVGFGARAVRVSPLPGAAAAAAAAPGVVSVAQSVCGAHILAQGFDRSGAPNPFPVPASLAATPGPAGMEDPIPLPPSFVPAGALVSASSPATLRGPSGSGSWTAPLDAPYVVRLRWDNSFSWVASKTVTRRVDVVLASEEDRAADAREAAEGAPPAPAAPGGEVGAGGPSAAAIILRARDPADDAARARAAHRVAITAASSSSSTSS